MQHLHHRVPHNPCLEVLSNYQLHCCIFSPVALFQQPAYNNNINNNLLVSNKQRVECSSSSSYGGCRLQWQQCWQKTQKLLLNKGKKKNHLLQPIVFYGQRNSLLSISRFSFPLPLLRMMTMIQTQTFFTLDLLPSPKIKCFFILLSLPLKQYLFTFLINYFDLIIIP